MAVFLIERGQIAAKIETTKGTDVSPVAADAGIEIYDLSYTPSVEVHERETIEASFDKPSGVPGSRFAEITFRSPIQGRTGAGLAPAMSVLLRACGLSETIVGSTSVTYAPITAESSQETITIDVYRDGKLWKVTGCAGNCVFEIRQGDVPFCEFTFMGLYVAPSDTALLSGINYVSVTPPQPVAGTLSFFSTSMLATGMTYDLGNDVQLRESIASSTGRLHAVIVNRDPTINIDPEDELVATLDFLSKLTSGNVGELTMALGSVAGNTHTWTFAHTQIVEAPFGDRNSQVTRDLVLRPRKKLSAGDDHISYAIS